jgi:hypothetical protein
VAAAHSVHSGARRRARRRSSKMSSQPWFRVRFDPTRRGGSDEAIKGLSGSGDDRGTTSVGADGARPASERRGYEALGARK